MDLDRIEERSAYVTMRDGVRLAVQVLFQAGRDRLERRPAVLVLTRYGRGTKAALARWDSSKQLDFIDQGFVVVSVDVRGSGASFGDRSQFNAAEEILNWEEVLDTGEVLDWIISQDWSDGNIFATGVSYPGNTSELAQVHNHPALRAVSPRFTDFDLYAFLLFPGGARDIAFTKPWGALTSELDHGFGGDAASLSDEARSTRRGRLVNGDDRAFEDAQAAHRANLDFYARTQTVVFRDDARFERRPRQWRSTNICDLTDALATGARPAFHWASWLDAGTAAGAIARFLTLKEAPMIVKIGAWNHGATHLADPFLGAGAPEETSGPAQVDEIASFFRGVLTDRDLAATRRVDYLTLGAQLWQSTPCWPPAGFTDISWHLAPGSALSRVPEALEPQRYVVDFEASTGEHTRWTTQLGGVVNYLDRQQEDQRLLLFDSPPFDVDTEITGTPVVTLHVMSAREDGLFIAYLEAVSPDGSATYLTEGVLRALHRNISRASPVYETPGPARSYRREDCAPAMPAGEIVSLQFALLPTSVLIRAGWRLRLALAGADKRSFARVPESGPQSWVLHSTPQRPSKIVVPQRAAGPSLTR
jgi:putative CocE/NonD family hydrolase